MTKSELKEAIRSEKIGEAVDRLPEDGNFAASIAIHEYPKGMKCAKLELNFFPRSVTVEAPKPPTDPAADAAIDPDKEVR